MYPSVATPHSYTAHVHWVSSIGFKAHEALLRGGGVVHPISELANSGYWRAGGQVIWIGSETAAMHPRTVLVESKAVGKLGPVHLESAGCLPWHPPAFPTKAVNTKGIAAQCQKLEERLDHLGTPAGFGTLLAGRTPAFPLNLSVPQLLSIADAYRGNDAEAVYDLSLTLLGVGPGLTPSGDDFTGAALFTRRALSPNEAWGSVAARLMASIEARSHMLSATLFADMATGHSFAPLHRLVRALISDASAGELIAAARSLLGIGHSSGWDMLTGVMAGLGTTVLDRRGREGDN